VPTTLIRPGRIVMLFLLAAFSLFAVAARADAASKPRVILMQDGEVDDMDSFIRYLYYSNEFDTAGIVYTSSTYHYSGNGTTVQPFRWTGTDWVNRYLDEYAQIRPNLVKHADGYPTADYLKSVYKIGNVTNVGEMTQVTDGSELIKNTILDDNPQTLYLLAWGGTNTAARALKSIQDQYQNTPQWPAIQDKINKKVVIYNILTQDTTLNGYIRPNWPGIKVIDNQSAFWAFAYLWTSRVPAPNQYVLRVPWMEPNLLTNTGPLMAEYRTYKDGMPTPGDDQNNRWNPIESSANQNVGYAVHDFISEGDSPSYMFLFDFNGLRSSENPTYGGWGGRFAPSTTSAGWIDTPDQNPYSTNANNMRSYPLTRWLPDLQNDFAARVAWGNADTYAKANHAPVVTTPHLDMVVPAGQKLNLSGSAMDPDGNSVTWKWWEYTDADTYAGTISIDGADTSTPSFTVPADAKPGDTIHVIEQVTDNGTPALTRYQRIILTVGTPVSGSVGGTVPATLSLTLGAAPSFGAFTPGVAKDYTANMTANVISTAGDATLSVADGSATAPGHLVNGTFSLPSVLQAKASSPAGAGAASFADVGGSTAPTSLLTYTGPVSNDPVAVSFNQHISAGDALRTGSYTKTLTFTLSTTAP
jgi:Protein of unknown function (DUF1593)